MSNNNGDLMEKRIIKRDEKCPLLTGKTVKKMRKTKAENASLITKQIPGKEYAGMWWKIILIVKVSAYVKTLMI